MGSMKCPSYKRLTLFGIVVGFIYVAYPTSDTESAIHTLGVSRENRDLDAQQTALKTDDDFRSHKHSVDAPDQLNLSIILLGYYRTGSTLTASVLTAYPGSFFVFEPLQSIRKCDGTYLLNGTYIPYNREGRHFLIQDALACNIGNFPLHILMREWVEDSLSSMRNCLSSELRAHAVRRKSLRTLEKKTVNAYPLFFQYPTCRVMGFCVSDKIRTEIRNTCLQKTNIVEQCKNAPLRIFKYIRLSFGETTYWLNNDPSLKVVTLLRDPRGYVTSHLKIRTPDGSKNIARAYCTWIRNMINEKREYLDKYSNNKTYTIQYEHLATNPINTTQNMYAYLHIPFVSKVRSFVWRLTMSGKGDANCVYCVNRGNGTKYAFGWKSGIKRKLYDDTNSLCADVIDMMGFNRPPYEQLVQRN